MRNTFQILNSLLIMSSAHFQYLESRWRRFWLTSWFFDGLGLIGNSSHVDLEPSGSTDSLSPVFRS